MGKNRIKIEELSDSPSINIALDTIKLNKQALIFANTKNSAAAPRDSKIHPLTHTARAREQA